MLDQAAVHRWPRHAWGQRMAVLRTSSSPRSPLTSTASTGKPPALPPAALGADVLASGPTCHTHTRMDTWSNGRKGRRGG